PNAPRKSPIVCGPGCASKGTSVVPLRVDGVQAPARGATLEPNPQDEPDRSGNLPLRFRASLLGTRPGASPAAARGPVTSLPLDGTAARGRLRATVRQHVWLYRPVARGRLLRPGRDRAGLWQTTHLPAALRLRGLRPGRSPLRLREPAGDSQLRRRSLA